MSIRQMKVTVEGKTYDVTVEILDDATTAPAPAAAPVGGATIAPPPRAAAPAPAAAPVAGGAGKVTSPLAGNIIKVHVAAGDPVTAGQVLVTLEAMKMNTEITAPAAGSVSAVHVADGAVVGEGALLVEIG
ncbi:MAG: biotin/lipoyl-containing protein [Planctomycetota bacterium]|jgi:biotin carboxyl carrier protein